MGMPSITLVKAAEELMEEVEEVEDPYNAHLSGNLYLGGEQSRK